MSYKNYPALNKNGIYTFWYMSWDNYYDFNCNFFKKYYLYKTMLKIFEEKIPYNTNSFLFKNVVELYHNKSKSQRKDYNYYMLKFSRNNKFKKLYFIGKLWILEFQNWITISFTFLKKKLKKKRKNIKKYNNMSTYKNFFLF